MKKIIYSFGVILALSIASCTDFVDPAIPYNNFETGAYLRTLASTPNINFFAIPSAQFSVTVEAVDIQDGKLVRDVDVFAARRRGPAVTAEVKIGNIPASEFKPHTTIIPDVHPASGSKYPAATFTIGIPAVLQALGLTQADINGGDFIEFRLLLNTTDGRTFTNSNLSPDISGGLYYRSPFFYRIPVVCPSALGGTYNYVSTDMFCAGERTGTVTWTQVAGTTTYTSSDFAFGSWIHCYGSGVPGGSLRLSDACNKISVTGTDQYGDSYRYLIEAVSGTSLTIKWDNTYGEFGTVVLTRTDGTNWPPLTN